MWLCTRVYVFACDMHVMCVCACDMHVMCLCVRTYVSILKLGGGNYDDRN